MSVYDEEYDFANNSRGVREMFLRPASLADISKLVQSGSITPRVLVTHNLFQTLSFREVASVR